MTTPSPDRRQQTNQTSGRTGWHLPEQSSPESLIAIGVILALGSGGLACIAGFDDGEKGWLVLWLGCAAAQVVLLVGVIAMGVKIGLRASRTP